MDKSNNLVLKIVDDGKGFNVDSKKSGIGMKNILARVNECEGILNVKSEINKGTEIKVIVPFNPQVN
jgi:signal transduction histidine kinase